MTGDTLAPPSQTPQAIMRSYNSSVIRQKSESQYGYFKKTKHARFSEKRTSLAPDTHTYICVSGDKKCSFFGKFDVLCFLETPVLRFALLPYYRQIRLCVRS